MKKLSLHNKKGGVGKTTTSGNISFGLSKTHKTIMIDGDPQGNLSTWFLTESPQYELADALTGKVEVKETITEIKENLSIIPTFAIDGDLKEYAETKLYQEPFVFDDLMQELENLGFDIAIVDLGPGMNLLNQSIIGSMDEVITPLTAEFFSLDGMEIFNNDLQKINKRMKRNVKHNKIICNGLNKSFSRHRQIYKTFEDLQYSLFTIPQDSKLAESQLYNQSIYDYYPESKSIPEIEKICGAIWQ